MEEFVKRGRKPRLKKDSREIRVKTKRHSRDHKEVQEDLSDILRQIARSNGYDICQSCQCQTPLTDPICVHCGTKALSS